MNEEKDQLLKEIAAAEEIIAKLPSYKETDDRAVWQERAKHQTNLNEKKGQLQLIEEEKRIASVMQEHLELHPYMLEKECPICIETFPITDYLTFHLRPCCGGGICNTCMNDILSTHTDESRKALRICPLCRAEHPKNKKGIMDVTKKLAEKGDVCAKQWIAMMSYVGSEGISKNRKLSLKLLRATRDSHPGSAHGLAEFHKKGECGCEKSEEIVINLLKISADGGYRIAQEEYAAKMWWKGMGNGKERVDSALYATLACSNLQICLSKSDDDEIVFQSAYWILGVLFQFGEGGMKQSWYLAKYYLQMAADNGDPFAYFSLAQVLITVGNLVYDGNIYIPGFSPVPKALYWARKAFAEKDLFLKDEQAVEEPRRFTEKLEAVVKQHCANCKRCPNGKNKLMGCVRCRAAWYCCKECQIEHWNAGHKVDCIKPKTKKKKAQG